jgi:hypothetical protein
LGTIGALIIAALVALVLYYAYKGLTGEDEAPSCRGAYTDCLQNCRRTRTEAAALQSCQGTCQRDFDACERRDH